MIDGVEAGSFDIQFEVWELEGVQCRFRKRLKVEKAAPFLWSVRDGGRV